MQRVLQIQLLTACLVVLLAACKPDAEKAPALFEVVDHTKTGLHFSNELRPSPELNMLQYMYFYNGAGVGAGDFNKDGLTDLFFASNQQQNKLYLNTGSLTFKDVTEAAQIPQDSGWSTGVSVADVNQDGLLDLYVCRVGNFATLRSQNQLLICTGIGKDGIPVYADSAKAYGLNFSGFSTQAAFFDYDLDGDLDLYLLNHSLRYNSTFAPRQTYLNTYDSASLSGDRLYRNDGRRFTDVTKASGINSSVIGYGLGIAVSDINLDGFPDLYIGNDFHENDYLYINQGNSTFKDRLTEQTMHTSQFSMGVDVADANNDAWPEIISMDMLPSDPAILKRSLGEDEYNVFNIKIKNGYHYQYARNTLQWNRGNGFFSEIGLYAGVYATDWSWAPLWMDFDNDGWKDLFVSNGIPKRLNDIDYVNYISNEEVQRKIRSGQMQQKDLALIDKFPEIKLPDRFFGNTGKLSFRDLGAQVKNSKGTFSNGAVYADLDNDGDLDIVVNTINEPVILYKNNTNDQQQKSFLELTLQGPRNNLNATGAKLLVFAGGQTRLYEKYSVKGFLSSMEIPLHVGLDKTVVDSMLLIWPDNTFQRLPPDSPSIRTIRYTAGLPTFDYGRFVRAIQPPAFPLRDVTKETGIAYLHKENHFVDFDREPLIPHAVSTEGPALAVGDVNQDGLDDLFVGASKWEQGKLWLQQAGGRFRESFQPALANDSTYEDVDACWVDVNNDHFPDLVVASGGNEYYGQDSFLLPRVYINDGHAHLTKRSDAFKDLYVTQSAVVPYDFTGDGHVDLFIGGRTVPWEYGRVPASYLLENDGTGKFRDVTAKYAPELAKAGMVTSASWADLDKDGDQDLVLALEWDGICAFINERGTFKRKWLTDKKGWWSFAMPFDIDHDGDLDLVAGNLGLNSRLRASDKEPVRLYYYDFDNNGKKEQLLTYYISGREIPFASKGELEKQLPMLKKGFLHAEDFAKASLQDLFTKEKLDKAEVLTANYFSNAVLINQGNGAFALQALPWEAQLTTYRTAVAIDANHDSLPDFLLGGNFYDNNIQMGRYDADPGTILINLGKGAFRCENIRGASLRGQTRRISSIRVAGVEALVVARNNDSLKVIKVKD